MIGRIFTVGGLTLVSRATGFFRDVMLAAVLGAGPVADAFFVALRLPNHFRAIFAEGAFSAAFVPAYARIRAQGGPDPARAFADRIFTLLLVTQLVLLAIAVGFAAALGLTQLMTDLLNSQKPRQSPGPQSPGPQLPGPQWRCRRRIERGQPSAAQPFHQRRGANNAGRGRREHVPHHGTPVAASSPCFQAGFRFLPAIGRTLRRWVRRRGLLERTTGVWHHHLRRPAWLA